MKSTLFKVLNVRIKFLWFSVQLHVFMSKFCHTRDNRGRRVIRFLKLRKTSTFSVGAPRAWTPEKTTHNPSPVLFLIEHYWSTACSWGFRPKNPSSLGVKLGAIAAKMCHSSGQSRAVWTTGGGGGGLPSLTYARCLDGRSVFLPSLFYGCSIRICRRFPISNPTPSPSWTTMCITLQ